MRIRHGLPTANSAHRGFPGWTRITSSPDFTILQPFTVPNGLRLNDRGGLSGCTCKVHRGAPASLPVPASYRDNRKSTRLNSSHLVISYAVFCLKKKKDQYYILLSHHHVQLRY